VKKFLPEMCWFLLLIPKIGVGERFQYFFSGSSPSAEVRKFSGDPQGLLRN